MDMRELAIALNSKAQEIAHKVETAEGFNGLMLASKAGVLQEVAITILEQLNKESQ